MRFNSLLIALLFLALTSLDGCGKKGIDTEVYDDIAVIEGVIVPVTEDRVRDEIRANPTVLLHFTSYDDNCGYCVRSNTFVNQLAQELAGELRVGRVSWNPWQSIDDSAELLESFGSRGVPFLILCKNGRVVWRHVGFTQEDAGRIGTEIRSQL